MDSSEDSIWVADHLFLESARFLRQRVHKILLASQVKALVNLVAAAFWISDTGQSDRTPGQGDRIPERYTDIVLYHVRSGALIQREEVLGFQGIRNGEVTVCLRGDAELLGLQSSMIRENPDFPVTIPIDPGMEGLFISFRELCEFRHKKGISAADEPGGGMDPGEMVLLGDLVQTQNEATVPRDNQKGSKTITSVSDFDQLWNRLKGAVSLMKLADELALLRQKNLGVNGDPEIHRILRHMAMAEIAALAGEGGKTLQFIKGIDEGTLSAGLLKETSLIRTVLHELVRE